MNEEQIIKLIGDDNEEIILYVEEQTIVAGVKYLLCADSLEDEAIAYIIKVISENDDDETYEFVENDTEFDAVAKIFEELLDDDTDLV